LTLSGTNGEPKKRSQMSHVTTMPTKTPTTPKVPKKPRATTAKKKEKVVSAAVAEETIVHASKEAEVKHAEKVVEKAPAMPKGQYIFATGRRKTAVANVRLYTGKGEATINKKPIEKYFQYSYYLEEIQKPFQVTGLVSQYDIVGHLNGGGPHSQAQALQHGISIALGKISEDVRKVLKKNGLLTRDDRKKERKKPGLKRARRSPQWAKR